jgi:hypothetical protein
MKMMIKDENGEDSTLPPKTRPSKTVSCIQGLSARDDTRETDHSSRHKAKVHAVRRVSNYVVHAKPIRISVYFFVYAV